MIKGYIYRSIYLSIYTTHDPKVTMPNAKRQLDAPFSIGLWSSGTVFSGVMELRPAPLGWVGVAFAIQNWLSNISTRPH